MSVGRVEIWRRVTRGLAVNLEAHQICKHINVPPSRPTGIISMKTLSVLFVGIPFQRHQKPGKASWRLSLMSVRSGREQALSSISFLEEDYILQNRGVGRGKYLARYTALSSRQLCIHFSALSDVHRRPAKFQAGQWTQSKGQKHGAKTPWRYCFFTVRPSASCSLVP
jgi:hypothetical protein